MRRINVELYCEQRFEIQNYKTIKDIPLLFGRPVYPFPVQDFSHTSDVRKLFPDIDSLIFFTSNVQLTEKDKVRILI